MQCDRDNAQSVQNPFSTLLVHSLVCYAHVYTHLLKGREEVVEWRGGFGYIYVYMYVVPQVAEEDEGSS